MDEFTIGELFYCLIQDVEDRLICEQNPELDGFVELLYSLQHNFCKNKNLSDSEKIKLENFIDYTHLRGLDQLSEDAEVILEQINEIK